MVDQAVVQAAEAGARASARCTECRARAAGPRSRRCPSRRRSAFSAQRACCVVHARVRGNPAPADALSPGCVHSRQTVAHDGSDAATPDLTVRAFLLRLHRAVFDVITAFPRAESCRGSPASCRRRSGSRIANPNATQRSTQIAVVVDHRASRFPRGDHHRDLAGQREDERGDGGDVSPEATAGKLEGDAIAV